MLVLLLTALRRPLAGPLGRMANRTTTRRNLLVNGVPAGRLHPHVNTHWTATPFQTQDTGREESPPRRWGSRWHSSPTWLRSSPCRVQTPNLGRSGHPTQVPLATMVPCLCQQTPTWFGAVYFHKQCRFLTPGQRRSCPSGISGLGQKVGGEGSPSA